jgi:hypothetical protein
MSKIPFNFGQRFQDNMMALMLKDAVFTDKACKYILPEYLHSDAHKWLFERVKKRFSKDGMIPSRIEIDECLKAVEKHRRKIYQGFIEKVLGLDPEDPIFICDRLTDFAKRTHFADMFSQAQLHYNSGETQEAYNYVLNSINDLHLISFQDDQSIGVRDFENIRRLYVSQRLMVKDRIPTGIKPLDTILRGGLSKFEGELGVILAEAKKGKSVALIHFSIACLKLPGLRVAHFVLEGSTETQITRYESRMTGIPTARIANDEITSSEFVRLEKLGRKYGDRLDLIPMNQKWDYTTGDIEAKVMELERRGRKPDLIVLDYADLLQPREKSREGERMNQRAVFRDLKKLAMMKKVAIWTATQAQRPKDSPDKEKVLRQDAVSESYEKARVVDFLGSLNQTPHEKKFGILRFHFDIYRNAACDKTIRLLTDFDRMIFYSPKYGYLEGEPPSWMMMKYRR